MGFNGGGGGQLLNHQHDGTLVADGGPLDFRTGVTQASLTSGDITFSDGVHLARLPIGATGESLIVSGALPSWGASSTSILGATGDMIYASAPNVPAALNIGSSGQILAVNAAGTLPEWKSGGKLELIENFIESGVTGNTHVFTFPADLRTDYAEVILVASYFNLAGQLYVTINNQTGAVYNQGGLTMSGTRTDTGQNQLSINHDTTSGDTKTAELNIFGNADDGRLNGFWKEYASLTTFETGGFYMGLQQSGTITSLELSTSAGSWGQGSTFDVYGYKI